MGLFNDMADIGSNKWWLFWTVVAALCGILIYSLIGYPKQGEGNKNIIGPEKRLALAVLPPGKEKEFEKLLENGQKTFPADAEKLIEFTKKTACRRNVQTINLEVEFWYVKHEGLWPRADLSDIGRDTDFFPSGVPACPVDGSPYRLNPITHRVIGHEHSDIKFDYNDFNVTRETGERHLRVKQTIHRKHK
jgi:hypothetical protein